MKNIFIKYYIGVFYLCSTLVLFAQPGTGSDNGGVDGDGTGDVTPASPIDDYLWLLAVISLFFVFMKFKSMQDKKI
jgi:hypothetical protein